jgi:D-alanyl-D-alanine carboxypeptidase
MNNTNFVNCCGLDTDGDTIGTLDYYYNGEKIGSVNVISSENIEKADFLTQIKKVFGRLLK